MLSDDIVLFGCGAMGSAMLLGWLDAGIQPRRISVVDPGLTLERQSFLASKGIAFGWPIKQAGTVFIAVKPDQVDSLLEIKQYVDSDALIISVIAGIKIEKIRSTLLEASPIVRAMSNLPAQLRRAATTLYAGDEVSQDQRNYAESLLATVGFCTWLTSEEEIDAVTALSGSGPAYVFLLAEAMAEAGVELGLEPETAEALARKTIIGAGELLRRGDMSVQELRHAVTSRGGATKAALDVFLEPDSSGSPEFASLVLRAMRAARDRSRELSAMSDDK